LQILDTPLQNRQLKLKLKLKIKIKIKILIDGSAPLCTGELN